MQPDDNMPKVSVIIPVYNVEQYIERCARSLFEQTLDDIEYIFVNDCTPDKSMEVLARVLEDYPARKEQVRIINMPVNSGQAKVRKVGVEAATGDYVIHCDSDDWVDITMYEKMWEKAVAEDLDMVICGYCETDGVQILFTRLIDHKGFESQVNAIISGHTNSSVWNKLVRKELYGFIDDWPVHNFGEDYAISGQIAIHCKSIGVIDAPLYYYFINVNGICSSLKRKEASTQIKANINTLYRHILKYGKEKEFRKELFHRKCLVKSGLWQLPWREYLKAFPEVNLCLFFESHLPRDLKLGHLSKCLGIHGISKVFQR